MPLVLLAIFALAAPTTAGGRDAAWIWVTDREAGTAVRFEATATGPFVVSARATGLRRPRTVSAAADGGAWVVESDAALSANAIVRLNPRGRRVVGVGPLGFVPDLSAASSGGVWVAVRFAGRVLRIEEDGRVSSEIPAPGVLCVEAYRGGVAFGDDGGRLAFLDEKGSILETHSLGGHLGEIRAMGREDSFWILDTVHPARLLRVERAKGVVATAVVGFPAEHLAVVAVDDSVWVADTTSALLRRYGPKGRLLLEVLVPGVGDLNFIAADPRDGSALLPRGAVLRRISIEGVALPPVEGFLDAVGVDGRAAVAR